MLPELRLNYRQRELLNLPNVDLTEPEYLIDGERTRGVTGGRLWAIGQQLGIDTPVLISDLTVFLTQYVSTESILRTGRVLYIALNRLVAE